MLKKWEKPSNTCYSNILPQTYLRWFFPLPLRGFPPMGHFILDPTDFDDIIKCSVVSEIRSLEASVKPGSITPYLTQQPQRVYNSPENQ